MKTLIFSVTGMGCAACQSKVRRAVEALPGVEGVNVSLLLNSMSVQVDEAGGTTAETIVQAVADAGYAAIPAKDSAAAVAGAGAPPPDASGTPSLSPAQVAIQERDELRKRLVVSLCCLLPLMILAMPGLFGLTLPKLLAGRVGAMMQLLLAMGIMGVNGETMRKGMEALRRRSPDMSTLAAVGSLCALFYSFLRIEIGNGWFFDSTGMILTIFTLGQYLESHAKARSCSAITALLELRPRTATVLRDGQEIQLPIAQVAVGDTVVVHPGEAIPVDGVILEGHAFVDQSALTGEPIPVERQDGDRVSAATLDTDGVLRLRAEAVGEDTTLAEIIRMVTAASASRAPIARLADQVCGWFVPAVMAIALLTFLGWHLFGSGDFGVALSHAIAVLVISCPCAMGLATPVAIMVGTGRAARLGILFKNAEMIQRLAECRIVVIDKTGTVTSGTPAIADIRPAEGHSDLEALAVAAVLEAHSRHPIAAAFAAAARERFGESWSPVDAQELRQLPGRGITAQLNGSVWHLGNAAHMAEHGVGIMPPANNSAGEQDEEGAAILYLAEGTQLVASFLLKDTVRPDSPAAIAALQKEGCRLVMLTGDAEAPARAVAAQCGFRAGLDIVRAGLLPKEKACIVEELRKENAETGERVVMVGDGINDAPALAAADVGLAIGSGTQVAAEAASVVLMHSTLSDVHTALRLSRAVMRNVRQNLFWAFGYNFVCIPLAAGLAFPWLHWHFSPMLGCIAMACSSLCVTLNALRLRRAA